VVSALAEFFADTLGLNYNKIMDYHEEGMGFGVIAQACWMSVMLDGEVTASDILAAKKSGNFSSIEIDGETPKNWGQFKKAVLSSDKAHKNLGAIMSGRKGEEQEQETATTANQSRGKSKKNKGRDEEGSEPRAKPPGKGKDKAGKPDTPPGQNKDGSKGKGKYSW
jgi:hypothetical protein